MSTERRSGFGQGFSKEVDSIMTAAQLGHLYLDEVRANLRVAGMVLRDEAIMADYMPQVEELQEYDEPPVGLDTDEGDDEDA